MINNSELKYIQSFAHKKHWAEESVFIVEGPKMLQELLASDWVIRKIIALPSWIQSQGHLPAEVVEVDEIMLARLSLLQTPNQVMAIVEKKVVATPLVFKGKATLLLDGIQDPGNLGTIIRTADWFGIHQIVVSEDTAGWYNPKVIQSTMGSCFRVGIVSMDLQALLQSNVKNSTVLPVYGAVLTGNSINETKMAAANFILIGNESKGVRENLLSYISNPIAIPRIGEAESLNAAVATGIILAKLKA
ncbi:MAG: RNA methyltransferase [Bacteroidetes bacterium]|jgi:TrmH family RNA methyltransferase|nr:RNA methyltransferase [Bacteroidota bacterium]